MSLGDSRTSNHPLQPLLLKAIDTSSFLEHSGIFMAFYTAIIWTSLCQSRHFHMQTHQSAHLKCHLRRTQKWSTVYLKRYACLLLWMIKIYILFEKKSTSGILVCRKDMFLDNQQMCPFELCCIIYMDEASHDELKTSAEVMFMKSACFTSYFCLDCTIYEPLTPTV